MAARANDASSAGSARASRPRVAVTSSLVLEYLLTPYAAAGLAIALVWWFLGARAVKNVRPSRARQRAPPLQNRPHLR
jgi:hypothetical protein